MSPSRLSRRLGLEVTLGAGAASRVRVGAKSVALDPYLLELPQHLELMAARLQNAENLYSVLVNQAKGRGRVADELTRVAIRLRLGESIDAALTQFAEESSSQLVSEFVSKVLLSLRRGTPLAGQLQLLASVARSQLKNAQLRAAGRNELKMLIPLVFMILPVTIAFAVFPSLQLLQLGF